MCDARILEEATYARQNIFLFCIRFFTLHEKCAYKVVRCKRSHLSCAEVLLFSVCRFLVSVCYSKAKVAAACAGIVYFLSYVPYMYIAIREEAAGDRISAFVKSLAVRGLELKLFIISI